MDGFMKNLTRIIIFSMIGMSQLSQAQTVKPTNPAGAQNLKILTLNFNSEAVMLDYDFRLRDRRFGAILEWIFKNNPDVVLFQEAWNFRGRPSVVIAIAEAAGYDYVYNVGMGIPGIYEDGNGMIVKKGLHLSQTQAFELPYGKWYMGDGKHWVLPFSANSFAVGGRITLGDGSSVYLYSTHLISASDPGHKADVIAIDAAITKDLHVAMPGALVSCN